MNANARSTLINMTGILEVKVQHPGIGMPSMQRSWHSTAQFRHRSCCSQHCKNSVRVQPMLPQCAADGGACAQATFTPGKYTMQLSAKAYEGWMFKEQGLPHDLIARCGYCFNRWPRVCQASAPEPRSRVTVL